MTNARSIRQCASRCGARWQRGWLVVAAGVALMVGGVRVPASLSGGIAVQSVKEQRPGPPRHESPDDESPEKTADEERENSERKSDGDGKELGNIHSVVSVERAVGRFLTSAWRRLQVRAVRASDLTIRGPPVAC
jgi:hypothetical protein